MSIEITMPRLSDTMERGTIVSWNVKEGQEVAAGDVLGDIETDKATMELQNFDDGVVAAILLEEGQEIDVGKPILVLAEEGEDAAEVKEKYASGAGASAPAKKQAEREQQGDESTAFEKASGTAVAEPPKQETEAKAGGAAAAPSESVNGRAAEASGEGGGRIFVSPLARKIAEEKGIDLATIEGTGPSGRIVKADVEAAAGGGGAEARHAAPPTPEPEEAPAKPGAGLVTPVSGPAPEPMRFEEAALEEKTVEMSNMRATIARRLLESKTSIPHYQVTVGASMDKLIELRKNLNSQLEDQGVKLSVNDFLVRACALAMHQHPYVNASWGEDGKSINLHAAVNIGVAIALPPERGGGLVVATLRQADRMGLRQISAQTRALAEKARTRGLTLDEMADSTFTISNLGMFGVEHFTAIINPPNSAILAVGAAVEKPVVRDGQVVVGHEMSMTMSSDHRVIDGAMAAEYLGTVKRMLESPATLLV